MEGYEEEEKRLSLLSLLFSRSPYALVGAGATVLGVNVRFIFGVPKANGEKEKQIRIKYKHEKVKCVLNC